jgi:hypothetical protein
LLSNFNKTAIIVEKPNNEVPPLLIKGKGIPIIGKKPIVIPILIAKWTNRIPAKQ